MARIAAAQGKLEADGTLQGLRRKWLGNPYRDQSLAALDGHLTSLRAEDRRTTRLMPEQSDATVAGVRDLRSTDSDGSGRR